MYLERLTATSLDVSFVKDYSHENVNVYFDVDKLYCDAVPVGSIEALKQTTFVSLIRGSHRATDEQRETMKSMSFQERAKYAINACAELKGSDDFEVCFLEFAEDDFEALISRKEYAQKSRGLMSERLRNYTCADDSMETSKPIYVTDLPVGDDTYKLNVMFNTSHAKILMIHDLVSDDECQVLKDFGIPNLRRATVADEDGTAIVSEHRKAQ